MVTTPVVIIIAIPYVTFIVCCRDSSMPSVLVKPPGGPVIVQVGPEFTERSLCASRSASQGSRVPVNDPRSTDDDSETQTSQSLAKSPH